MSVAAILSEVIGKNYLYRHITRDRERSHRDGSNVTRDRKRSHRDGGNLARNRKRSHRDGGNLTGDRERSHRDGGNLTRNRERSHRDRARRGGKAENRTENNSRNLHIWAHEVYSLHKEE